MRSAVGALGTLVLFFGITGAALGSRVEAGASAPSFVAHGAGNDGEGPVTLTLRGSPGSGPHAVEVVKVHRFHFANGCAVNGSTLVPSMTLDSSDHFYYVARGFTVQGTFENSDTQATGTARVEQGGCDSGVLAFSINMS
jgi:hypothetical protein